MEQDQGSTAIENTQEYLITKDKKAKYTFRLIKYCHHCYPGCITYNKKEGRFKTFQKD